MREIQRLELLALDAIEALAVPTVRAIVDYIGKRRRVWPWSQLLIVAALMRLESEGTIEARRTRDGHKVRWLYRRTATGTIAPGATPCSSSTPGAPCSAQHGSSRG